MKTLFVSLAAITFAFFIGCESSITDPTVPLIGGDSKFKGAIEESNHTYNKDKARCFQDIIKVKATIIDEKSAGNVNFDVAGTVLYNISSTDANEGTSKELVKVKLTLNADITSSNPGQVPWKVKSTATEVVFVPSNQYAFTILELPYEIVNVQGTKIELKFKYRIYHTTLALEVVDITKLSNEMPYTKVF